MKNRVGAKIDGSYDSMLPKHVICARSATIWSGLAYS